MPKRPSDVTPEDEQRVHDRLDEKVKGLSGQPSGLIKGLLRDVRTLYDLLRDKEFRISWSHKAKIIACLLYFIAPLDVVPDFILGVGYLDDAVVVGYTLKILSDLVEEYRVFRRRKREGAVLEGTLKAPSEA